MSEDEKEQHLPRYRLKTGRKSSRILLIKVHMSLGRLMCSAEERKEARSFGAMLKLHRP
jgi:hypothetical protein